MDPPPPPEIELDPMSSTPTPVATPPVITPSLASPFLASPPIASPSMSSPRQAHRQRRRRSDSALMLSPPQHSLTAVALKSHDRLEPLSTVRAAQDTPDVLAPPPEFEAVSQHPSDVPRPDTEEYLTQLQALYPASGLRRASEGVPRIPSEFNAHSPRHPVPELREPIGELKLIYPAHGSQPSLSRGQAQVPRAPPPIIVEDGTDELIRRGSTAQGFTLHEHSSQGDAASFAESRSDSRAGASDTTVEMIRRDWKTHRLERRQTDSSLPVSSVGDDSSEFARRKSALHRLQRQHSDTSRPYSPVIWNRSTEEVIRTVPKPTRLGKYKNRNSSPTPFLVSAGTQTASTGVGNASANALSAVAQVAEPIPEELPRRPSSQPELSPSLLEKSTEEPGPLEQQLKAVRASLKDAYAAEWSHHLIRELDTPHGVVTIDPSVLQWEGPFDLGNPRNWMPAKRWLNTAAFLAMTLVVGFASSIFSAVTTVTADQFDVSTTATTLGVSLFVLGFASGPIIFGPLSEIFGRKWPTLAGFFIFALLQIPGALVQDLATILIMRYLSGFFACSILVVFDTVVCDMWQEHERLIPTTLFGLSLVVGPSVSPIAGAFLTQSSAGWRWTAWLTLIVALVVGVVCSFVISETSACRILQLRARRERSKAAKEGAVKRRLSLANSGVQVHLDNITSVYLTRPFTMLVQQPVLALLTLYVSLMYGVFYWSFIAIFYSFNETRGWSLGISSLPLLCLALGAGTGGTVVLLSTKYMYERVIRQTGRAVPERRLVPLLIGSICMPVGLLWFGWTASASVDAAAQIIATFFLGLSLVTFLAPATSYIVDVYGDVFSCSALAANTMIRSLFGFGFPLLAPPLFENIGVQWGCSVFAFIALCFLPVPWMLFFCGERLRQYSGFSKDNN